MILSNSDNYKCNFGIKIPIMIAIHNNERKERVISLLKSLSQQFTLSRFQKNTSLFILSSIIPLICLGINLNSKVIIVPKLIIVNNTDVQMKAI